MFNFLLAKKTKKNNSSKKEIIFDFNKEYFENVFKNKVDEYSDSLKYHHKLDNYSVSYDLSFVEDFCILNISIDFEKKFLNKKESKHFFVFYKVYKNDALKKIDFYQKPKKSVSNLYKFLDTNLKCKEYILKDSNSYFNSLDENCFKGIFITNGLIVGEEYSLTFLDGCTLICPYSLKDLTKDFCEENSLLVCMQEDAIFSVNSNIIYFRKLIEQIDDIDILISINEYIEILQEFLEKINEINDQVEFFKIYKAFSRILKDISYSLRKFADSKEKGKLSKEDVEKIKEDIENNIEKALGFVSN